MRTMRKRCEQFRNSLIDCWDEDDSVQGCLEESDHYKHCPACQQYVEEFLESIGILGEYRESILSRPDFNIMRANVWEQIEERQHTPAVIRNILRPAILAPVFVVFVALIGWWVIPEHPEQTQGFELDEAMYLSAVREVDPVSLPEEVLQSAIEDDMRYSVYEYLMQSGSYTALQEAYYSEDEWNQILQSLAEQQM